MKRTLSSLLCAIIIFITMAATATSASATFSNDWSTWSQGGSSLTYPSKIPSKGIVQAAGCHLVAQVKLMAEAGIINSSSFDPDIYFKWQMENGYLGGKQEDGTYSVGENGIGAGMIAYAKAKGTTIIPAGNVSLVGLSANEKKSLIQSYLKSGYYIILDCKAHETYVMRNKSLSEGTPWISDSGSKYLSVSTRSGIYAYTGTYGGGGGWEAAFNKAYLYSVNGEIEVKTSATVTTGTYDNLTQTSATLRGSFTTIGSRASECGMYIGTSKSNMIKLGSDKVNTYGTSMYYSTGKCAYTLEPDTTYYYQAYVIVDSQTYKGEVKSFTTLPNPKNTGVPVERIVLDRTSLTIKNGVCTQLTATTTPAGQKVTWTSSDPSVATVSSNGGIDTHKAGTTTITAKMTYNNTTYPAACKVTVTDTRATVTTKGADSITQTGAIVRGEVSVSSGTVTECGMYIGKSKSSLTKLGSDKISKGTTFYYNTSKYGYTLTAGTTYYYQAYAIVDGETIKGDVKSFITDTATTSAAVTTKGADNITQTSAIVRGEVTVSSGTATECGMFIGKSTSSLTKLSYDKISKGTTFYYSTSKYGYTLTAGTTYYYQAYAIVNGETIKGEIKSFTTPVAATVSTKGADTITQTSAIVRGEVTVSGGTVTECGMYIGGSASGLTKLGSDSISKGTTFYYSTSKYGYALTAGTTYYYQAYAIVDGTTFWGDVKSFTTQAAPVVSSNTTATVVNTNGQYLAINNAPAASPKYSTQIGRIPPGGTVTVDTSKTSGSWYWVTYDGVSGYAYGKYLSLN